MAMHRIGPQTPDGPSRLRLASASAIHSSASPDRDPGTVPPDSLEAQARQIPAPRPVARISAPASAVVPPGARRRRVPVMRLTVPTRSGMTCGHDLQAEDNLPADEKTMDLKRRSARGGFRLLCCPRLRPVCERRGLDARE